MKKVKANACLLLGLICLPTAGAESGNFTTQVIVTTTAACLFVLFFVLGARLLAQESALDM